MPEEALELGKNAHKAEESRAAPTDDFPPLNTARIASTASDKTAPPPARAFPNVRDPPAEEEASASTSDSAAPDRASPLSTGFQKVRASHHAATATHGAEQGCIGSSVDGLLQSCRRFRLLLSFLPVQHGKSGGYAC